MQTELVLDDAEPAIEPLSPGAVLLRGFAAGQEAALIAAIMQVAAAAPFRHMIVPTGHTMSAALTSCGAWGWTSSRQGYRYKDRDPDSDRPWPAMPEPFASLAARAAAAAGYRGFVTDSGLINRYAPGARMGLHHDSDETDMNAPIVSVSLGLPATFLWGGARRNDKTRKLRVAGGDVVVFGGPARLFYHGVDPVKEGQHPLAGGFRYNLTFRKVR